MGLGTNISYKLPTMPEYQGLTGIQGALARKRANTRQKQQDYSQTLKDYAPIAEQQTIRNVLGNVNKQDGFQTGLSRQLEANALYNKVNDDYASDMKDIEATRLELNKATPQYTADGVAVSNPALTSLDEAEVKLNLDRDNKIQALNTDMQRMYSKDKGLFDGVSDPKDTEKRLTQALMAKGINADEARKQAKTEIAPYYAPGITDRQKEQNKVDLKLMDTLAKQTTRTNTRQDEGGGKTSRGSYSSGSKGSKKYLDTLLSKADDLLKVSEKEKERSWYEGWDNWSADSITDISEKIANIQQIAPAATDSQILRAMSPAVGGSSDAPILNEAAFKESLALILEKENNNGKDYREGSGNSGGFSSTSVTSEQMTPEAQKQYKDAVNRIEARTRGSKNATLADIMGTEATEIANQRYNLSDAVVSEEDKKPKQLSTKEAVTKYGTNLKTLQDAIKNKKVSANNPEIKKRLQELEEEKKPQTQEEKDAYIKKLNEQSQEGVRSNLKDIKKGISNIIEPKPNNGIFTKISDLLSNRTRTSSIDLGKYKVDKDTPSKYSGSTLRDTLGIKPVDVKVTDPAKKLARDTRIAVEIMNQSEANQMNKSKLVKLLARDDLDTATKQKLQRALQSKKSSIFTKDNLLSPTERFNRAK